MQTPTSGLHGRVMYQNLLGAASQRPSAELLWHHFTFGVYSHMRASGPPPDLKEFDEEDYMQCPSDGQFTKYLDLRMNARLIALDRGKYVFDMDTVSDTDSETKSIEGY
jgi:hypothetical protein